MNSELLRILDQGIRYSLWVFMVSLLMFLVYVRIRLTRRSRRVGELYEEIDPLRQEAGSRKPAQPRINQWPVALQSTLLALLCALVFLLVFLFTPLPFFKNFAATDAWQITPLRLTSVQFDRFHEGFSLSAEVWNQTEEPLAVEAQITVIGPDSTTLAELTSALQPNPVPSGAPGRFEVRYEENSPFIKGYRLRFRDETGADIAHVIGFDVR